jgi:hypothetical protein
MNWFSFIKSMHYRKAIRVFGSITLIVAFGVFNIGLPAALYLCPMMNDNPAACPMRSDVPTAELSITNVVSPCCSKVILAERNTTPFLKVQSIEQDKIVPLATLSPDTFEHIVFALPFASSDDLQLNSPPVFLLNSSFLI